MIKPAEAFLTRTLREEIWGKKVARILSASIASVDPAIALARALNREKNHLEVTGRRIDLEDYSNLYLLSIGKAGISMAVAAADLISDHLTGGFVLTKPNSDDIPARYRNKIQVHQGGHPIPDAMGARSTEKVISCFSQLSENDLVIVLISGGGSALLTAPASGISLTDIQQTNRTFLEHGLNIQEINTIRKHLSLVKGGQLTDLLQPARMITLILSDVVGDPMDMIASGPTVPDPSTFKDALSIIERFQLEKHLPASVTNHLLAGAEGKVQETPKPGDPIFKDQINLIIASIQDAIQGGLEQAQKEGFNPQVISQPLEGEARLAGENIAETLIKSSLSEPQVSHCLIAGGETTVTLTDVGKPGKGGRNLELALAAVRKLAGHKGLALVSLATDGEDSMTDAAGAIVTGETLSRAEALGLDPDEFLDNHDSYSFFQALDDLLLPGVTGTNVNDLCFLFSF